MQKIPTDLKFTYPLFFPIHPTKHPIKFKKSYFFLGFQSKLKEKEEDKHRHSNASTTSKLMEVDRPL